ncbi:MAG: SDR family NAD(P)-dependent oxidoreductase [Legionellales bacterium]
MFVITGGGSGIGQALAFALANRGKKVLIVGRREHLLQETASVSPLIEYLTADVSTADGLQALQTYCEQQERIDGLVNNAGVIEPIALLKDVQLDDWHHTLNTNLNAALFLPQKIYPLLTKGRVLNIGSGAAYFPIKGWSAYCVTKAALAMLTQCWQLESETIAFASVMPGIIDTDMQAIARSMVNIDKERADFYKALKENNRLISVETVAAFLSWLLLDVDSATYSSKEWDIYDTTHHDHWLKPPHQVLHWEFEDV